MSICVDKKLWLKSIFDFPPPYSIFRFHHLFGGEGDEVAKRSFLLHPFRESLEQFEGRLQHYGEWKGEYLFILDGFDTVGLLQWFESTKVTQDPVIELGFFIRQQDRNKGYGTWAIQELEKRVEPHESHVTLAIVKSNLKAVSLYKKLGYKLEDNKLADKRGFLFMIKDL